MIRLFVSLYLFIAIALVGLSFLLENLFFDDAPSLAAQPEAAQLFEAFNLSDERQLAALQSSPLVTRRVSIDTIGWPAEDRAALANGQALSLFDDQGGQQLYRQVSPTEILEISLTAEGENNPRFLLYSAVFFVLLGVALAIWVWPLWRDLAKLNAATLTLQRHGQMSPVKLRRRSLIRPVADTINHLYAQTQQLLQTQRELTGAVAHEFRTPLSRLKFALAMQPANQIGAWEAMQADVNELEKLVQEMLNYTSMEAQNPELDITEIPLRSLSELVLSRLPTQDHHQQTLTVTGDNCHVLADSHYLERALENLLLNARRYAVARIDVRICCVDEFAELRVEDDGPGVDDALAEKIFEPFYRPDDGRDRRRGGAGLGLAIVKRIAGWLDGNCWVERSALGGAAFVLRLRRVDSN